MKDSLCDGCGERGHPLADILCSHCRSQALQLAEEIVETLVNAARQPQAIRQRAFENISALMSQFGIAISDIGRIEQVRGDVS